MGDYKRQHTITKAYLRGFVAGETPNTLWRYDKSNGSCEAKSVDNATVSFYAYSFRKSDGNWNHQVEKLFGEIETEAIPLLPKLATASPLTELEKHHLSLFIATIIRRPIALIEHFCNTFLQYRNEPARLLAFFDSLLPKLEKRFSQEEIQSAREAMASGEFNISFDRAKAQQLAVWIQSLSKNSQIIAGMHWQVWKADSGCRFLTSDAPAFVRRHGHDDDMGVVGIARDDLNAELTFPISKKSLLVATHKPAKDAYKAPKTRVRELNARIIRMAHKHVFATEDTESTRRLVAQNMHFSAPLPDLGKLTERMDEQYGLRRTT